jgi:hypothetical protein
MWAWESLEPDIHAPLHAFMLYDYTYIVPEYIPVYTEHFMASWIFRSLQKVSTEL